MKINCMNTLSKNVWKALLLPCVLTTFIVNTNLLESTYRTMYAATQTRSTPERWYEESKETNTDIRIHDNLFHSVEDIRDFINSRNTSSRHYTILDLARRKYLINCSNIHEIRIGQLLGHGVFKAGYIGTFRGIKVAVKTVVQRNPNAFECSNSLMRALKNESIANIKTVLLDTHCDNVRVRNMIREMVYHAVLDYPNIVRHLGYCIKSTDVDMNDTSVLGQHIVSVFEYGEPLKVDVLKTLPWRERIKHCRELANLIALLQNSLIGPIIYGDCVERHFVLVDGRVKLIDMDYYMSFEEPRCARPGQQADPNKGIRANCSVGLTCVNGICEGEHALLNMRAFTDVFFRPLLEKYSLPNQVYTSLGTFLDRINLYKASPTEIVTIFDKLLEVFAGEDGLDYPVYFIS